MLFTHFYPSIDNPFCGLEPDEAVHRKYREKINVECFQAKKLGFTDIIKE